jgi:hypothetical protein
MVTTELAVLAIALLLSTTSITIYSWFDDHGKQLRLGIWAIRITAILPGLVSILWAIYAIATGEESTLAMALSMAGIMLVGGSVQLLSLLVRKQQTAPDRQFETG